VKTGTTSDKNGQQGHHVTTTTTTNHDVATGDVKTGPNDASRVVWAIGKLLFCFVLLLITNICLRFYIRTTKTSGTTTTSRHHCQRPQRHHVVATSPNHNHTRPNENQRGPTKGPNDGLPSFGPFDSRRVRVSCPWYYTHLPPPTTTVLPSIRMFFLFFSLSCVRCFFSCFFFLSLFYYY
jgi:hypothetical protein